MDFQSQPDLCGVHEHCSALRERTLHGVAALLRAASSHREAASRAPDRHAAARRAELYIRAHLCEAISLRELVAVADVRERALRQGFRDVFGRSPTDHVTVLRLNAVHAHLRAAVTGQTSVGTIARQFGFTHLGRFASAFRAHYGELPSETLREWPS